jgi:hypothetical protein
MSYRRFNVSAVTGNFTGATTGAAISGAALHVGENQRDVVDLAAHLIATITMTGATVSTQWQASNDASTWFNVAHNPENPTFAAALVTGVASGTNRAVGAPLGVYGYKYTRCQVVWGSTTAGTTNDAMSIGYTYRQLEAGSGL